MRNKIVAGNWKMNKTLKEAVELTINLSKEISSLSLQEHQKLIIFPPAVYLAKLKEVLNLLENSNIQIGAQNCYSKDSGAFTGEISPAMLASMDIPFVLIGHSERRSIFNENSALLKDKVDQAIHHNLNVVFCCGEPLEVREADKHQALVKQQLEESLFHLNESDFESTVIAYEPVWAIGTGVTASPEQAEEMHHYIRTLITNRYSEKIADNYTILYGGSCKPTNAETLFANKNVDGGLIGGASLKAESFRGIIDHLG